jgi:hypothetical protein
LTGKQNWQTNPKQMLYCACVRNVFRILFSDIAIPYDADEMNADDYLVQSEDIGFAQSVEACSVAASGEIIDSRANERPSLPTSELRPIAILQERLKSENISIDRLDEWIKLRCHTKNMQPDEVVETCIQEKVFPSFKKSYLKWLNPAETVVEATA